MRSAFSGRPRRVFQVMVAGVAWVACGSGVACHEGPTAPSQLTRLPRPLSADEQQIVAGSNDFAFGLFGTIVAGAGPDSNVFVSPLSASMALGMAASGAAGTTLDSMRSVLGFAGMPVADMAGAYHSLIDLLLSLDPSVDFRIANALWYEQSFSVLPSFLTTATTDFDARVTAADFADPATVSAINHWVDSSTAGRIPTLLDGIPSHTVMYLLNAIYFHGSWTQEFDPRKTRDTLFTTPTGAADPVALMHMETTARVAYGPGFTAADLGYGRGAYVMTLILPTAGVSLDSTTRALRGGAWSAVSHTLDESGVAGPVDVALPKFTLGWGDSLIAPLTALGMGVAFRDSANFSNMSHVDGLVINQVVQKTFVQVDEAGTTAAAATGVGIGVTVAPAVVVLRADRPFIYLIRERLSGTILFVGAFCHPPA
jgi:serine protease inhibitor